MTGHGGRRLGAGRKTGSLTKRTRDIAERAAAQGKTPLEIMLANMLHFHKLAESAESALAEMSADTLPALPPEEQFKHLLAEVKKAAGLREMAQTCARDAAPFVHPRLAAIEHSVADKRDAADWTRAELVAFLHDARAGGERAASANGRGDKPDSVH